MTFDWNQLSTDVSRRLRALEAGMSKRLSDAVSEVDAAASDLSDKEFALMAANMEVRVAKARHDCAVVAHAAHTALISALPWHETKDAA